MRHAYWTMRRFTSDLARSARLIKATRVVIVALLALGAADCALATTDKPHEISAPMASERVQLVAADYRDSAMSSDPSSPTVSVVRLAGASVTAVDSDGDGMPDAVEAVEGRNPGVKDNAIFAGLHANSDRWFAMQQYRDFLNREGDASGVSYWTEQLANNSSPRAEVIQAFAGNPDFAGAMDPMVRLYLAYFNRVPDFSGLNFWSNEYLHGRYTLVQISQYFASSPEFNRAGQGTNAQLAQIVDQLHIRTSPQDTGSLVIFYTGLLDTGAVTRGELMVTRGSETSENIFRSRENVYVIDFYFGMLQRSPESGGYDYWVNFLRSSGAKLTLIQGFLGSPEYRARFLP